MHSLWHHLQKTPTENEKRYFSMSTRRPAEPVEGLNSSLAAGDLWPKMGRPIEVVKGLRQNIIVGQIVRNEILMTTEAHMTRKTCMNILVVYYPAFNIKVMSNVLCEKSYELLHCEVQLLNMLGASVWVYHTLKSRIEPLIPRHFTTPWLTSWLC